MAILSFLSRPHDRQPIAAATLGVRHDGHVRITLTELAGGDADRALADMNAQLVMAGVAVYRIEPDRVSLEERFLDVTSRLGGDR